MCPVCWTSELIAIGWLSAGGLSLSGLSILALKRFKQSPPSETQAQTPSEGDNHG